MQCSDARTSAASAECKRTNTEHDEKLAIIYMAKHGESATASLDRPAIEITEEMIEAGLDALMGSDLDFSASPFHPTLPPKVVSAVFLAMLLSAPLK